MSTAISREQAAELNPLIGTTEAADTMQAVEVLLGNLNAMLVGVSDTTIDGNESEMAIHAINDMVIAALAYERQH